MNVQQIAKSADVSTDTVRYYARIGLLRPYRNAENGYRIFSQSDLSHLRFIRQAQSLNFSLAEIRTIIEESREGTSPCPRVREILKTKIDENRAKLDELVALQNRMEEALEQWEKMPDGIPDGDHVCHLIESTDDCKTSSE